VAITRKNINVPSGLRIDQITPRTIEVRSRRLASVDLPVTVRTAGKLPSGLVLVKTRVHPLSVRITGPKSRLEGVTGIKTDPLDLSSITQTTTQKQFLSLPSECRLLDESQGSVRVTVVVKQKKK
jgi:YbbR domain-containing protein